MNKPSNLLNIPVWRESKSGFAGVAITPGEKTVWLCFVNRVSGLDKTIVQATGGISDRQILVTRGKNFKRRSLNRYQINPGSKEDYETLIESVLDDFGTIGGVIHTWSCVRPGVKKDDRIWKHQFPRTLSVLWLGNALGSVGNQNPIPVNFITTGLIRGRAGRICPANYALAAAAGVVQSEYPNLITRTIDLGDRKFDIRTEEAFQKVLHGDRHHLKLAMKDGSWWRPAFEKNDPELIDDLNPVRELENGGVYVIFGGVECVGRRIAAELSLRAENLTLVLLSHSDFPQRKEWESLLDNSFTPEKTRNQIQDLIDIERNGSRIQIVTTDLSEPGATEFTLNALDRQHEGIQGVIHAAASSDSVPILENDNRAIRKAISAKAIPAQGIYNYFLSPNHNTEFVIFCSSVVSELGAVEQSCNAAANAFLDGLAQEAYFRGLPFFSISWPDWEGIGLETCTKSIKSISPQKGLECLMEIISYSDSARTVVSGISFNKRYQRLLSERQPKEHRNEESLTRVEAPVEQMISIWKRTLHKSGIGEDDNYFELGGDSLFALAILRRIEETFGQSIPMSNLIKAPTPKLLVQAMGLNADVETIIHRELPDHILPLRIEEAPREAPVFCIHGGDGSVMFYQGFANRLDEGRSVYGIESKLYHDEAHQVEASIEEMAKSYLDDIKEVEPEGPYCFAGYSFGALVALRMAQLAEERGDEVEGVIIYDMFNPDTIRTFPIHERLKVIWDKGSILPFWPRVKTSAGRCGEIVWEAALQARDWFRYKTGRIRGEQARHMEAGFLNESLIASFKPEGYGGRVLLVVTEDQGDKFDFGDLHGWRNTLTGRLTHRFVTGNHLEIFTGNHLEVLVNHTNYFLKGSPTENYEAETVIEEAEAFLNSRFGSADRKSRVLIE